MITRPVGSPDGDPEVFISHFTVRAMRIVGGGVGGRGESLIVEAARFAIPPGVGTPLSALVMVVVVVVAVGARLDAYLRNAAS